MSTKELEANYKKPTLSPEKKKEIYIELELRYQVEKNEAARARRNLFGDKNFLLRIKSAPSTFNKIGAPVKRAFNPSELEKGINEITLKKVITKVPKDIKEWWQEYVQTGAEQPNTGPGF